MLDAYAAGIPVISACWESFSDIVDEHAVGLGYAFGDIQDLIRILTDVAESPEVLNAMKPTCIQKARRYRPEVAAAILLNHL